MSDIQANVPLINIPFVDPGSGLINEAWFMFLVQLFRRTGGESGGTTLTLADVLSLEDTFASAATVIGPDALSGETIFGSVGPKDALSEMVFAPTSPSMASETFSSGTDFTPGTTTTLTLKESFSGVPKLFVFFDAAWQGDDQYSLNGTSLVFTSVIPVGTNKVYVRGLR